MNCSRCGTRLRVCSTHKATGRIKTARAECPRRGCYAVHTLLTVMVADDATVGLGAATLAKRLAEPGAEIAITMGWEPRARRKGDPQGLLDPAPQLKPNTKPARKPARKVNRRTR